MPKVKAIHTCIVDGQVHPAGTEFEVSAEVLKALVEAGAAEVVETEKKATAKPKKAAKKTAKKEPEPEAGEDADIL